MKIADLRATTVTVPLEAPLRHANGCHWGGFVRTHRGGGNRQWVDRAWGDGTRRGRKVALRQRPGSSGTGRPLDREKLRRYGKLFRRLGKYPHDRDPYRPGWTPIIPNDRWAEP